MIYRSTDGGANWTEVRRTPAVDWYVEDFTIDPADDSRIFVADGGNEMVVLSADGSAETHEYPNVDHHAPAIGTSSGYIFSGSYENGALRSADGGQNWSNVSNGLPASGGFYEPIYDLNVSPAASSTVWANVGYQSWYVTTDAGDNWSEVILDNVLMIAGHPSNATKAVAAAASGVYFSTDSGASWTASNSGIEGTANRVAYASVDGNTLYATTYEGGVFVSTDGGTNWSSMGDNLGSYYLHSLGADLTDGDLIVAGSEGSFRSTDDGASWDSINFRSLFVDGFAQSPTNPDRLFVADSNAGVYVSENRGSTWELQRDGLAISSYTPDVHLVEASPSDGTVVAGGHGLHTYNAGDGTWTELTSTSNLQFNEVSINPVNSDNIVAAYYDYGSSGLMITTDGGSSWNSPADLDGETVFSIAFAPSNPDTIFAGVYKGGVYRSVDGGLSWDEVIAKDDRSVPYYIAVDPHSGTVYVAFGVSGRMLMMSTDGGNTWETTLQQDVYAIAFTEHVAGRMAVATTDGGVLARDGQGSWKALNEPMSIDIPPARTLAFDVEDPNRIYASFEDIGLAEYTLASNELDDDDADSGDNGGDSGDSGGGASMIALLLVPLLRRPRIAA